MKSVNVPVIREIIDFWLYRIDPSVGRSIELFAMETITDRLFVLIVIPVLVGWLSGF